MNILLEAIGMGLVLLIVGAIPVALMLNDIEPSIEIKDEEEEK